MFFKRLLLVLLLVFCVMPAAALADGFAVLEWSAGGVAMGEAYMFADDDASLLAYNPAGITRLQGRAVSGGISYINPRGRTDFFGGVIGNGETWSNAEAPGFVPNLYYTHQVNDRLTWGLGFYTRFGNSSEFDPNFPGRFNSYKAKMLSLSAVPTLAWQATPQLSLSVGAEIMYLSLDARKKVGAPVPGGELDFKLDGNGFGYGWNVGMNYDFDDKNSFAMVYRSKVGMQLDGDITIPGLTTTADGKVTLPDSLTLGFGHRFNDRTRVEVGATQTWWSTYDRLTINSGSAIGGVTSQSTRKDWKDVWRYQAGVEHRENDRWTIMFGYAYDNAPMPDDTMDYMVPTGDRQTISTGFKYHNKNATWTFAYGYMWIKDRIIPGNQDGHDSHFGYANSRDNNAHILSLSYALKLK